MKNILLISIVIFALHSCKQSPNQQQTAPETPAALQENSSKDYSLLSKKRYQEDLVESLYAELVDKTAELKDLEKRIDYLNDVRTDSVTAFNSFDQKNSSYYSAAGQHVNQITDSLLRNKLNSIIQNSLEKYNTQIAQHNNLITLLNSKVVKLQDLHIILKLIKTLPQIEKYQKDNIPNTNSINKAINEFDKTIKKVDSLTNR